MSKTQQEQLVGVVLVTHGSFGASLLEAAELVVGPQENIQAVSVPQSAAVDELVVSIREAVEKCNRGAGVLVLTDLFGGTPTTLSLSLLKSYALEVISGVNMPMVVKAIQSRDLPLAELASQVKSAGRQGIVVAGEMLTRRAAGPRTGNGS
ncbi:MAG: PTS sugar transporter subunit IIA [Desulfovibrio sp.]